MQGLDDLRASILHASPTARDGLRGDWSAQALSQAYDIALLWLLHPKPHLSLQLSPSSSSEEHAWYAHHQSSSTTILTQRLRGLVGVHHPCNTYH